MTKSQKISKLTKINIVLSMSLLKTNRSKMRSNIRIGILLILITVLQLNSSIAKESFQDEAKQKLTLTQAIQTALANATEIKQALNTLEDAEQQVLVSWGEVFPKIDTDLGYQRNLEVPVNFLPAEIFGGAAGTFIPVAFGADNSWTGGITVSQTLFKGEAFVGIATAKLYRLAQTEAHRATAQKVVTQTRIAYYNVLIAKERYNVELATINRLKQNLKENEARVKAGLVDDYDVLRIRVQLKNQEPALARAENGIEEAKRNLNIAMGISVKAKFLVQGDLIKFDIMSENPLSELNNEIKKVDKMTPVSTEFSDQVESRLVDLRGDLRSLKVRSDLQDQRILADKTNFLPSLNASYSMRWNAAQNGSPNFFGDADQRARSQVLGINMKWNLYSGFKECTSLKRSKIEKKNIEEQRRYSLENAVNQTITAQHRIQNLYELAPSVKEGLSLAKKGYERSIARQKNGFGSLLDVTDAELQLRQAELNYADVVYSYLSAKAQYDFALGMVPFVNEKN